MNWWTLISRSLRFHARSHLGAALGAAIGSAVLIGALVMGDSVRGSLRAMALARIQGIELALASDDRFFRATLAEDLSADLQASVLPGMQVLGTASRTDASARANQVQVLGVTSEFWALSPCESVTFGFGGRRGGLESTAGGTAQCRARRHRVAAGGAAIGSFAGSGDRAAGGRHAIAAPPGGAGVGG